MLIFQLWNTFHEPDQVEIAFNKSLKNLNLDYIDLYLMHSKNAYQRVLKEPHLDPNDVDSYQITPRDQNGKKGVSISFDFDIFMIKTDGNIFI